MKRYYAKNLLLTKKSRIAQCFVISKCTQSESFERLLLSCSQHQSSTKHQFSTLYLLQQRTLDRAIGSRFKGAFKQ